MRVLIAYSSKYGSTRGIAQAIAEQLGTHAVSADVASVTETTGVADYDAVIVGSAIYMAQWMPEAREFLEKSAAELADRQVWLFSSGLSDTPSKDTNSGGNRGIRSFVPEGTEHRHFTGALDMDNLNIAERAVIAAARGKYGDHRDFDAIRAWADSIAENLRAD